MSDEQLTFKSNIHHKKDLNMHYVEVPSSVWETFGEFKKGKFNQRLWIHINEFSSLKWQCGIVALGGGMGYITISKERMKNFNIHFGDQVQVTIEKDDSEFGIEVAPEFLAVVETDAEAKKRFDQLTKGFQRYILYYIVQVKSSEKRIERTLLLLNNLKRTSPGKETFKELLRKD